MTAPASTTEAVNRLLAQLRSALGTTETPQGSNHNFITDWYNENVDKIGTGPWCQMTVTWAFYNAGFKTLLTGSAWTIAAIRNAQAGLNGSVWHDGLSGLRKGDQVYYDWTGSKTISKVDHVGTIESINADGTFYALEGNASNALRRMHRDPKYVVGYVRPAWARVVVVPPKPKPVPVPKPVPTEPDVTSQIKVIQSLVGVKQDGIWGPITDAAFLKWRTSKSATPGQVQLLQKVMGQVQKDHLDQDGIWGPLTDTAILTFRKKHLVKSLSR